VPKTPNFNIERVVNMNIVTTNYLLNNNLISLRTYTTLLFNNITTLNQLLDFTLDQINRIRNITKGCIIRLVYLVKNYFNCNM
jgi:hypothetical protein